jgi:uncharacterized protein YbjT (DUF2867 family)
MQTLFLIGATGNVGTLLLRSLRERSNGTAMVKAAARSEQAAVAIVRTGAQPVAFDLRDPENFVAALAGNETIFLLRPYSIAQLIQGKQVIDSARRIGASHIVTIGAHGAPDTPHPIIGWNFLVESYVERSGMAWTHLRPNFFMENILAQRDPASGTIFNGLTAPVSWIASSDIASVAAAVLLDPARHDGKAYSLASDRRTVSEIADLLSEMTGTPHRQVVPPREQTIDALVEAERERLYVEAINAGRVPEADEVFDTVADIAGHDGESWETFLTKSLMQ